MAEEVTPKQGGLKGLLNKGKLAGEKAKEAGGKAKSFGGKVKESGHALKEIWTEGEKKPGENAAVEGDTPATSEGAPVAQTPPTSGPVAQPPISTPAAPESAEEEWDAV